MTGAHAGTITSGTLSRSSRPLARVTCTRREELSSNLCCRRRLLSSVPVALIVVVHESGFEVRVASPECLLIHLPCLVCQRVRARVHVRQLGQSGARAPPCTILTVSHPASRIYLHAFPVPFILAAPGDLYLLWR